MHSLRVKLDTSHEPSTTPDIIGAGTGPAGPAMTGPFSAEVDTIITRSTFVWSQIAVLKFGRVRT